MDYHCLIASLGEIQSEQATAGARTDFAAIFEQITSSLSPRDLAYAQTLYSYYDVVNIIAQMDEGDKGDEDGGSTAPHNVLGQLSADNIALLLNGQELPEDTTNPLPTSVQEALEWVLGRGDDPFDGDENDQQTQLLYSLYRSMAASRCKFLKAWGATDQAIRTIYSKAGNSDRNSEIIDFAQDCDWYPTLLETLKINDILTREQRLDQLRWSIAENLTQGGGISEIAHTADINAILCYLVQLNIIERWAPLSKDSGKTKLHQIIEKFTQMGKITD